ncbi:MAG: hypothetical protein EOO62_29030 [Hymenobacter sp.]|nr:MAG: hypothetical protein EOO62_29030 [Hymenobacter sp.]
MTAEARIDQSFGNLIGLLQAHGRHVENRSRPTLGLGQVLATVEAARATKSYLTPYYFTVLPSWLGEYDTTSVERSISALAFDLDLQIIALMGGLEHVNQLRTARNKALGF